MHARGVLDGFLSRLSTDNQHLVLRTGSGPRGEEIVRVSCPHISKGDYLNVYNKNIILTAVAGIHIYIPVYIACPLG